MFIKKIDGPRVVILPDGSPVSRADLPETNTLRWTAHRKRVVAQAVQAGLISRRDACRAYALSDVELDSWCCRFPIRSAAVAALCD